MDPRLHRGVSLHQLKPLRDEEDRGQQRERGAQRREDAGGKLPIAEEGEVEEGLVASEASAGERAEGDGGDREGDPRRGQEQAGFVAELFDRPHQQRHADEREDDRQRVELPRFFNARFGKQKHPRDHGGGHERHVDEEG